MTLGIVGQLVRNRSEGISYYIPEETRDTSIYLQFLRQIKIIRVIYGKYCV